MFDAFGFQDNVIFMVRCSDASSITDTLPLTEILPADIKLKPKGWLEFQIKDKGMFGFESGPVAAPWHILSTCRASLATWTLTQPLLE